MLNYKLVIEGYVNKIAPGQKADILSTLGKYQLSFHFHKNFTTAVISGPGGHVVVGNSKRNKLDPSNPTRGRAVALCRALDRFVEEWLNVPFEEETGVAEIGALDVVLGLTNVQEVDFSAKSLRD